MLGSLPAGNSYAGLVEKSREMEEDPGILSHCGGTREWDIPLRGSLLTYQSSLYRSELCFRVPPKLLKDRQFCG